MSYAFNLHDLTKHRGALSIALASVFGDVIDVEPGLKDGNGTTLRCDDAQAAAMSDALRTKEIRTYKRTAKGGFKRA